MSIEREAQIVNLLCEGMGICAVSRIANVSKNSVLRVLERVGRACIAYHDIHVRNIHCTDLQCDELVSFVGGKRKNLDLVGLARGWGDRYTWTCIEPRSKLLVSWHTGTRSKAHAMQFLEDVRARVPGNVRIATDCYAAYLPTIAECFGNKARHITHASHKEWKFKGNKSLTNSVERMNLTIRQGNRRFTRKTNAFSKKPENHEYMLGLFFLYYNFARLHKTHRVTPAMEAGISTFAWTVEEIVLMAWTNEDIKFELPRSQEVSRPSRGPDRYTIDADTGELLAA